VGRYDAIAGVYEGLLRVGSFGRIEDLYRAVAGELVGLRGAHVLELGCGPGAVTPFLLEALGDSGRVLGVDLSAVMIEAARRKAETLGWHGVRFEVGDAATFAPAAEVDAIVCSLFLTVLPDCGPCLENALKWLRPGGRLVILDSIPQPDRPLARLVIRAKAPLVGAHPSALPLEFARARLEGLHVRHFFGGVYTLVSGRVPGGSSASS
jgi:ubiquinone/menaquinone biosynthesis C-methylase UbiE